MFLAFGNILAICITASLVISFIWLYIVYIDLIKKKNQIDEATASIDVQLKKRYDLIPNILTIAKEFMEHEKGLIEDVTKLRLEALNLSNGNMQQKLEVGKQIQDKMGQIMVNVENYPQLKSNETMVQAMKTYSEVEEHIAAARRFYNTAVFELKNAVEIWPSSVFAENLNIRCNSFYYEAKEEERKEINAKDFFKK